MEEIKHRSDPQPPNLRGLSEFDDIRPYEPEEMKQAFEDLLNDRQFNVLMKGFAPWLPKGVRNGLLRLAFIGVKTPLDFQKRFMKPIVKYIIHKHTDGCTFDDQALSGYPKPDSRYTFVSNHRDIVLDSAFLDLKLVEKDYPTTVEIGIGDNLLIYPWIKRLVRMNKAFTVRRGLSLRETLAASQLMSRYIHFAVTQKKENIWLAQREGRAKDSDDRTQEAVLKMLAMGGDLQELNIVPLTISYEYDPCDYLKAQELQQKRDNPAFKKSRPRRSTIRLWQSGWIRTSIRVTSCSPATILPLTNCTAMLPMPLTIRKLTSSVSRTISQVRWPRSHSTKRMRLSSVNVSSRCMPIRYSINLLPYEVLSSSDSNHNSQLSTLNSQ